MQLVTLIRAGMAECIWLFYGPKSREAAGTGLIAFLLVNAITLMGFFAPRLLVQWNVPRGPAVVAVAVFFTIAYFALFERNQALEREDAIAKKWPRTWERRRLWAVLYMAASIIGALLMLVSVRGCCAV